MKSLPSQLLETKGAFVCKDVLSKEMAYFFTRAMLRKYETLGQSGDKVTPTARAVLPADFFLETTQETIWPKLEAILDAELLPTYSYGRLYANGDGFSKHTDRPSCEISITVQLGRSHHYAWPIYAGGQPYYLAEGDGLVYRGCDIEHWREDCQGPLGYYTGQAFFHFVQKNGTYAKHANDSTNRETPANWYVKHRAHLMETK